MFREFQENVGIHGKKVYKPNCSVLFPVYMGTGLICRMTGDSVENALMRVFRKKPRVIKPTHKGKYYPIGCGRDLLIVVKQKMPEMRVIIGREDGEVYMFLHEGMMAMWSLENVSDAFAKIKEFESKAPPKLFKRFVSFYKSENGNNEDDELLAAAERVGYFDGIPIVLCDAIHNDNPYPNQARKTVAEIEEFLNRAFFIGSHVVPVTGGGFYDGNPEIPCFYNLKQPGTVLMHALKYMTDHFMNVYQPGLCVVMYADNGPEEFDDPEAF